MYLYIYNVFRVKTHLKLIAKQINRLTELPGNCHLVWCVKYKLPLTPEELLFKMGETLCLKALIFFKLLTICLGERPYKGW